MSIDKTFHGELVGHSVGQMMAYGTPAKGPAAYVALEQVTGKLQGREGSFVLQHVATMDQGAPSLRITIVPGSGTGELAGVEGTLSIEIAADGKALHALEYALPAAR